MAVPVWVDLLVGVISYLAALTLLTRLALSVEGVSWRAIAVRLFLGVALGMLSLGCLQQLL
jgi:hypothetical protein